MHTGSSHRPEGPQARLGAVWRGSRPPAPGIFGELDFFLRNPRSFNAVATSDDTAILLLTRDALQSMQAQASQLAAALEHAVLKYLCFQERLPARPLPAPPLPGWAHGAAARRPACR